MAGANEAALVEEIRIRCQQQDSGELSIRGAGQQWRLYFFLGRLLFGIGEPRVRRWQRLWQQHCPHFSWQDLQTFRVSTEPWEYDLLGQAVDCGRISVEQARQLIQATIREVLVAASRSRSIQLDWDGRRQLSRQIYLVAPDMVLQDLPTLAPTELDPDLVLRIAKPDLFQQQVSPGVFQALSRLIDGQSSLWQVAQAMGRPVSVVSRSLGSFIQQGWLEPVSAADLRLPDTWRVAAAAAAPKPNRPCIACIDDSPTMGRAMERILAGYQVLVIEDPLKAIRLLHTYKPVLIFLDLLMPRTNGYELCASLRKTSLFQDTPIIILTGQDGIVDRVRAKLVGATEFLAKPPDKDKVREMVNKYLSPAP